MPFVDASTWAAWNTIYITTTATTSRPDATWTQWNVAATGTTSFTAEQAGTYLIQYAPQAWQVWNTAYEETREQREAREARESEAAERARAARREREAAKSRALELLGMVLTPEQMASYRERGWFEVTSSKGRRFRIRDCGQSGNVDLMPEIGDERVATYCAHPPEGLPDPDAHLAQALVLVTDEDEFLRVANCHYRRAA